MRKCLGVVADILSGGEPAPVADRLSRLAVAWAGDGSDLGELLTRVNSEIRSCLYEFAQRTDPRKVLMATGRVVDALRIVSTTVSCAHATEVKESATEELGTERGRISPAAAESGGGGGTADAGSGDIGPCTVLALSIPPLPGDVPSVETVQHALRQVEPELAARFGGQWQLSIVGGTVILPGSMARRECDDLVDTLSQAVQLPITAVVVTADVAAVPRRAVDQAHTVLDVVHRIGRPPGIYRFDDLALEYQLSRPGSGRDVLRARLRPLDDHPRLLETLERHQGTGIDRGSTARLLGIHPNTLDYRLRRIEELTGLDPARLASSWFLQSALVVRRFETGEEAGSEKRSTA